MSLTYFLLIFVLYSAWYTFKYKGQNLCNEVFWISLFWILCIGTYLTGGVNYGTYGFSIPLLIFLSLCFVSFSMGRKKGLRYKVYALKSSNYSVNRKFVFLAILGVLLYLYDLLSHNSLTDLLISEEGKKEIELSFIGTIGVFIMPLSLVLGLYYFTLDLVTKHRISASAIILLVSYTIPAAITGGRESILFVVIGIISSLVYARKKGLSFTVSDKSKNRVLLLGATVALILVYAIYQLSTSRFGEVQTRVFLLENNVSGKTIEDSARWGAFEFLYYNILSYFCRQIPFLDFTLQNYEGPYLFGFFELNILSRRLPDSFGLNYVDVFDQLGYLFNKHHVSFGRGWFTVLGAFICDFGCVGAVLMCYLCGYITGRVRKLFMTTMDIKYSVIVSLFCLSAFSTVQLGPFFQTMIYSTYIWWYAVFHLKQKK